MREDLLQTVQSKFPGIELESPIQGFAYLREFQAGITAYSELSTPTSKDDRWVGVCYFQLLDDMRAVEMFYRAIARGESAARINLAHAFGYIERGDEVIPELAKIDVHSLTLYDQALFHRVRSLHLETTGGNLREALADAEAAWRLVQGIPEFPLIAPDILSQLGVLHARIGRAQRALWYIERTLEISTETDHIRAQINQANLLVTLGQFHSASAVLEQLTGSPRQYQPVILAFKGKAAWGRGNVQEAIHWFEEGIRIAMEFGLTYEEFLCRIDMALLNERLRDIHGARENLARAGVLAGDRTDRLSHQFRAALFHQWWQEKSPRETLEELEQVSNEFGAIGVLQEQGWVRLHMAEMYRLLGNLEAMRQELDALQVLSITLQNPVFLAREWTLVPDLRRIAQKTHPKIAGQGTGLLEIYSLGDERLLLDSEPVNMPLKRGVELLTYFLENKLATLKQILLDVFPEDKARSAKSYFHQFRHQLQEHVPGLVVEYDRDARVYRLKSEIDILWDVAELRAGRKMGRLGIFLQSSGNEWAVLMDQQLDGLREALETVRTPE